MICDLTGKQLRLVVDEVVDRWRDGDPPDACAVLAEYPQLREHHSLAVDLAYEEFCLREESGEALNQRQFCQKFSQFQHSLARMLNLHRVLQSQSLGLPSQAKEKVEWPQIGDRWLDWTLLEEIGRGAFSRVFLAEEPSLGNRRVVVKCSTSGAGEAFLLGKLAHASVMPIHSIRQDEPRKLVGICMPYVGRVTLGDVLNRISDPSAKDISTAAFAPQLGDWRASASHKKAVASGADYAPYVARLIEKVARGLALAHSENVLHGDIKPSNIILSFEGEPMLVDFNLSDDGGGGNQRLGGTPPYMAPERLALLTPAIADFDRKQVELSLRSDVFSLGVVLYELLYGDTPYDFAVEELTAAYRETKGVLCPERSVAGGSVPRELAEIVSRAIALDPRERCSSVSDLADELARYAEKYESQKKAKRTRWRTSVAVALLAAATAIPIAVTTVPHRYNPIKQWLFESAERKLLKEAMQSLERKDYQETAEQLKQIPVAYSKPEVSAWIGYCLADDGDWSNSLHYFSEAGGTSDPSGIIWHNIGCCELQSGRQSLAIESFSQAVKCNPGRYQSHQQLAIAKLRIASRNSVPLLPGALQDIETAVSLAGDDPYLYFDAACIYSYEMTRQPKKPELKVKCEHYIRRALELGIAPQTMQMAILNPNAIKLADLIPASLPEPVPNRKKNEIFLPPSFDLQDVLERLP